MKGNVNTKEMILIKYIDEYFTQRDMMKESHYNKFKEMAESEAEY